MPSSVNLKCEWKKNIPGYVWFFYYAYNLFVFLFISDKPGLTIIWKKQNKKNPSSFFRNIDGQIYDGVVKTKEQAQQQYNQAVSRGQSAGIVR